MTAQPLTREERLDRDRDNYHLERWEATVRAVEAERDRWHEAYDIERGLRHGVEAERDAASARVERLRGDVVVALIAFQQGRDDKAQDLLRAALDADDAERGDG